MEERESMSSSLTQLSSAHDSLICKMEELRQEKELLDSSSSLKQVELLQEQLEEQQRQSER